MTINSFVALLTFADLGLGNGLMNAVATAHGQDNREEIRRLVSNATAALFAICCCICIAASIILLCNLINWKAALGLTSEEAASEVKPGLIVFSACIAANIIVGVPQRIQIAMQAGAFTAIWNVIGSALALSALLTVIHFKLGMPWLIAALLGGPILSNYIGAAYFFLARNFDLFPRFQDLRIQKIRHIAKLGSLFFVLQITGALASSSDNAIAARYIGAAAMGEYSICNKAFGAVSLIVGLLVSALWPAYSEAISRKDFVWVRSTLKASMLESVVVASVGSLLLFTFFGPLMTIWLGSPLAASPWLLAGIGVWTICSAAGNALAMFLNGAHVVREQLVISIMFFGSVIILKLALTPRFGATALPWIMASCYVLTTGLPYYLILPRIMRRLDKRD